ncbi:MAG: hypothetical protein B7Y25_07225 [Alphaproteobacteria bacterium 16-39-46]|nr:MAG: hypothetical protein B7Y25_07225 [Alphaproteobacteria bacterium 16-39-46]OZA41798.1 MAG: hypothetical protein B7X84_07380 [Alphaproteobacteria bacterium 17-39-52]HQS84700.1 GNAT family N-acetyltransferase [Alphaproteobacteria bacterium]HQS94521.1 GNAT family N-acetyltransferase [Alphaproteobacteria bacterium]
MKHPQSLSGTIEILIREPTQKDINEMVALSYQKRQNYERVQPQFWRVSERAEEAQTKWFKDLLSQENTLMLIAESEDKLRGFVIGFLIKAPQVYDPGGLTLMIDDFCVENSSEWQIIGKSLLEKLKSKAKAKGAVQVVVVSGAHDEAKRYFLKMLGLSCASEWYVGEII